MEGAAANALPDAVPEELREERRARFMQAAIGLGGQVAGRIEKVEPVAEIFERTVNEFHATVAKMAERFAEARA